MEQSSYLHKVWDVIMCSFKMQIKYLFPMVNPVTALTPTENPHVYHGIRTRMSSSFYNQYIYWGVGVGVGVGCVGVGGEEPITS